MAPDLLLTIATALLGVLTAAILALVNSTVPGTTPTVAVFFRSLRAPGTGTCRS